MAIPATYNDGKPYRPARGRHAPRSNVERFFSSNIHPVVRGRPSPSEFLRKIRREMKIRCYQQKTIKAYINALRVFLRWRGGMPHEVSSENVRDYLETLVDGGGSSSWVSINLSAIRTAFDKMCGRSITLGLQTPRRPKRLLRFRSTNPVLFASHGQVATCGNKPFEGNRFVAILVRGGLRFPGDRRHGKN